jgi:putative copper resistance protein D
LTAAFIITRFAHFAAAMSLFGASLFLAILSPPALRAALARSIGPILAAASVIAAATAILWLLLVGGEMAGGWRDAFDPAVLSATLYETQFGSLWQGRLVLALALLIVAPWRGPPRSALIAILAGVNLASLGLVGHAAMRMGVDGVFERANQALHLAAAGFWLGALAPLLVCLRLLGDPALKDEAAAGLRRFSGLGHVAVAAVLATGVVNIFMILGRWPRDFSSPYQACLTMKMATVVVMVLIALYNRYWLVPRRKADAGASAALVRNTALEIGLGAVVLALVSAFATFEPV